MRHTPFHRCHAIGVLLVALQSATSFAAAPVDPVNKNHASIAIKGYDTVAYFKEGKPVKASPQYSHSWNGATWLFASEENRNLFAADPAKYAPQFGGYCAWAVGHGYTANIDPDAWMIIEGKLYLNYNKDILKKWQADSSNLIKEGGTNGPKLHK